MKNVVCYVNLIELSIKKENDIKSLKFMCRFVLKTNRPCFPLVLFNISGDLP